MLVKNQRYPLSWHNNVIWPSLSIAYYTYYIISQSVYNLRDESYRKQEIAIKVNKNSFEKQTRRWLIDDTTAAVIGIL